MNFTRFSFIFVFSILVISSISTLTTFVIGNGSYAYGQSSDESHDKDNGNNEGHAQSGEQQKYAIITFDDGEKGQIEYAKPILDKYNFPATFFIVCNYISDGQGESEGGEDGEKEESHMNWNDLRNLQSSGYGIGSHTMNHDDLGELSEDKVLEEIVGSKECLENNGISNVNLFSYPFNGGSDSEDVISVISEYYEMARTATEPLASLNCKDGLKVECDFSEQEIYSVMGWSHDASAKDYGSDEEIFDRFVEVVESQNEHNGNGMIKAMPILVYHNIGPETGEYATSIDLFEKEMEYLKENGFKVISLSDLL